ncbi:MAG: hypothetical protein LBE36_03150 [Flavobacteriaceae bacterium]|jgi:hypothetical protein|nr:hypothetical protein [Flavobacteriaceae bacterium]
MKKIIFLLFPLIFSEINAQFFSGEIIIRDRSNYYLNQVYVTNLNDHKTVYTNYNGDFKIPAKVGDVVRFTSIVTEREDIKITKELLENFHNYVELKIAYYEIQEVLLTKFKPSGHLRKDVLSLKTGEKTLALKEALGLPEPKGDGLPTQLPAASFTGGGLTFGLESIYDIISGERKKKERLWKYEQMNQSVAAIKQYFGKEYFTEQKIPEHLIDNFLQFVYTSDNLNIFLENNNFEAIAIYIEKYLPIYQQRLKNSHLIDIIK